VIDNDSGFLTVLRKRAEAYGWEVHELEAESRPDDLVAMKLGALIVDPAAAGSAESPYHERICAAVPDLTVIVCARKSSVAERVRALRLGADDWVTKPCHPEEVLARVEAITRRRRVRAAATPAVFGELEIRSDQFQAFAGGRSLELTRREFELLQVLADAPGRTIEREVIYERVWGYAMAHGDRSVDVFVRKLRRKLESRSPQWTYIHTHFGVGYRFDPASDLPVEQKTAAGPPPNDAGATARSQQFHIGATAQ